MKVLIVGLGLIGASYAKGLTNKGFEVYGSDINLNTIEFAKKSGYVLDASINPLDYLDKVNLLIISLYPTDIIPFIKKYQPYFKKGLVITDTCGIKSRICYEATKLALPASFVGSHPMAGKEKVGIMYADENIFKRANFLICPIEGTDPKAVDTVEEIGKALDFGFIHHISPEHHDKMIAYTSQLTHAIAVSLVNSETSDDVRDFIGDSYRDLTRIAKINAELWNELFFSNKEALLDEIELFKDSLNKLEEALKNNDEEELKHIFRESKRKREEMYK